jgi:hypothetical protein
MLDRMHNAKVTSDELKSFYNCKQLGYELSTYTYSE